MRDGGEQRSVNGTAKPDDMTDADRWALVAEARATFGPLAGKQLAEKLGMVTAGGGPARIAGEVGGSSRAEAGRWASRTRTAALT